MFLMSRVINHTYLNNGAEVPVWELVNNPRLKNVGLHLNSTEFETRLNNILDLIERGDLYHCA